MKIIFESYTYSELVLSGVVLVSFIVFLCYYLGSYLKAVTHRHLKKVGPAVPPEPVSVVVVIQDDLEYIEQTLPLLLSQKYEAPYQVIVVNDTPELEETVDALKDMAERYPDLYVTTIRENHRFKHTRKLANTIGIKAARYDRILLTDTQSTPSNEKWLGLMSKGFVSKRCIVFGYTRIEYEKGFLNRIERAIHVFSALPVLFKAVSGKPFRVMPGNTGLTGNLFFDNNGYCKYLRLNSGENDLFFQRVRSNADTSVIISPSAVMVRRPAATFSNWYNRRKFNTYTYRYYSSRIKAFLTCEHIFRLFFWGAAIMLFVWHPPVIWIVTAVFVFLRFLIVWLVLRTLAKRTQERIPYWTCFFFDIIAPADAFLLSVGRRLKPSKDLWI